MKSKRAAQFDLRDHGVAVRRGANMSLIATRDPKTGRDLVYVGYNTGGAFIILQVDVLTGKCRQFDAEPGCQSPWGMIATPDGRVIVTSSGGHVSLLDPDRNEFPVVARAATWFWHVTLGCDGKYYLAGNGPNHLHRYDLATGRIENLGSVSSTQAYLRAVIGGNDGYVYGSIGTTAPQAIAYHIATGRITELLPQNEIQSSPFINLNRGVDGGIYATGGADNLYRLENGRARKVARAGRPEFTRARLSDGRLVRYVDPDAIAIGDGARTQYIPLHYQAPGCGIFHLAQGPRGAVYGSTIMPLYLFRYQPGARQTECLGRGAPDNGEAYSFGHTDGKLYYATYPTAYIMRYDPARPWQLTRARKKNPHQKSCVCSMSKANEMPLWDSNPKLLVTLGQGHCRPRAMHVDSQKRVWVGSYPEYGKADGGLACYDTVRGKLKNNPVVVPNYSIVCLTSNDTADTIYGGTDIILGSGTPSVETDGRIFAWDAAAHKLLWSLIPVPGATGITNLHHHRGKLYGTTHQSHYFIYDLAKKRMEQVVTGNFAPARQESMALGPDGNFYGITWMSLFRWRPDGTLQELWRVKGRPAKPYGGSLFHRGAAISRDRMYFAWGANVMSVRLPLEAKAR